MDHKTVRKFEDEIEDAIAEVVRELGRRDLPFLPSNHTMHLMAKAAVTVYEAAVENHKPGS